MQKEQEEQVRFLFEFKLQAGDTAVKVAVSNKKTVTFGAHEVYNV